ncbi:hypothetical protein BX616_007297, partial [Lobosporangium transversale]
PKSGIVCHLTLNEPLDIQRSKLIHTYTQIEPRFVPIMIALKHLTENPPLLPKLQLQPKNQKNNDTQQGQLGQQMDKDDRPIKEKIVQGIDCSFDQDYDFYQGFGDKNIKSVAELLVDFCRFFGYVFDYEFKEVNPRIGAFRWRPGQLSKTSLTTSVTSTGNSGNSSSSDIGATLQSHTASSSRVYSSPSSTATSATIKHNRIATAKAKENANGITLHIMDPFDVGFNVTASCNGDLVRLIKGCFQEAYEALVEGNINLAFSESG